MHVQPRERWQGAQHAHVENVLMTAQPLHAVHVCEPAADQDSSESVA